MATNQRLKGGQWAYKHFSKIGQGVPVVFFSKAFSIDPLKKLL